MPVPLPDAVGNCSIHQVLVELFESAEEVPLMLVVVTQGP
jgi:hypothetical protein